MIPASWQRRLDGTGLDAEAVRERVKLLALAREVLGDSDAGSLAAFCVPGRIELFGKHTDYAGGRSLLCAASQAMCVVARRRTDRTVTLADALSGERTAMQLGSDPAGLVPGWPRYPAVAAARLVRNFPGRMRRGADIALASGIPRAAGMSSSSALVVSTLLALAWSNELRADPRYDEIAGDPLRLASYAACVENGASFGGLEGDEGVGTAGGSEDHTAMFCAQPASLLQCAFVPARLERHVPLDPHVGLAIGASGVAAEKTGRAQGCYNAVSARAEALVDLWRRHVPDPPVTSAGDIARLGAKAAGRLRELASAHDAAQGTQLADRWDHFLLESERLVPAAAEAVAVSDWPRLGELASTSHEAAVRLLGTGTPETDDLVKLAQDGGALAASGFGAGFGGSVWALVETTRMAAFLRGWRRDYEAGHPHLAARSRFLVTSAGPPLLQIHP